MLQSTEGATAAAKATVKKEKKADKAADAESEKPKGKKKEKKAEKAADAKSEKPKGKKKEPVPKKEANKKAQDASSSTQATGAGSEEANDTQIDPPAAELKEVKKRVSWKMATPVPMPKEADSDDSMERGPGVFDWY